MSLTRTVSPLHAGQFPPEGAGSPAAPPQERRSDPWPWVILGAFAAASLVVIALMWFGYRIYTNSQKAETLLAAERYEEAIPYLQYVVRRHPKAWVRQRQLAICYLETDQPEKAIEHLERVREANPDLPLDVEYGIAWHLQGEFERSTESLRQALAREPSAAAHFYLGLQAKEAGRLQEAATHFQGAAADPEWDRRALPYRQEIANEVLGEVAPKLEAAPAPAKSAD